MASPEPTTNSSTHDGNSVSLRVTYLHAGNPRPPHSLGSVSLDTTVSALKSRLQSELLETPAPEEQRLIYQGRPLLQDSMTLREALRIEGPVGPLPYTLHIVIQPRQAASHFRPQSNNNAPQANLPENGLHPMPQPAHPLSAQDAHQQALRVQAMAQAQFNMLQQQLAQMTQQHGLPPPTGFSATFINGQPVGPIQPNMAPGQPHPSQPVQTTMNAPHADQWAGPQTSHHLPRPPPINGPNVHPPMVPVNGLLNPTLPNGQTTLPRPLSVPPLPRNLQDYIPTVMPSNAPPFPSLPPPSTGLRNLLERQQPPPQTPAQPTVWLASSADGPRAVLFAPGHGYFSSNTRSRTDQVRQVQEATNARNNPSTRPADANSNVNNTQPAAAAAARDPVPGQLALRQPAQGGAAAAQAAPNQNANQNQNQQDDLMGLIIQRGWLFLRLYMFTYVLSEPNTWRRWLLLSLAVLVCLLPRENPLNRLLTAARRHVDNLIGPPQPQARAQAQPQPRAGAGGAANNNQQQQPANPDATALAPRPTPVRGAANTTPEEAAARILRERAAAQQRHREANPNVLRDLFYRVEQAVALFLASLVPGVGERHVAAREEQRRLEAQAEIQAQGQVQGQGEPADVEASSSTSPQAAAAVRGEQGGGSTNPNDGTTSAATRSINGQPNGAAVGSKEQPASTTISTASESAQGSSSGVEASSTASGSDTTALGGNNEGDQLRARHVGS